MIVSLDALKVIECQKDELAAYWQSSTITSNKRLAMHNCSMCDDEALRAGLDRRRRMSGQGRRHRGLTKSQRERTYLVQYRNIQLWQRNDISFSIDNQRKTYFFVSPQNNKNYEESHQNLMIMS